MTSVVALYEALSTAPDERSRARDIAEAFENLEQKTALDFLFSWSQSEVPSVFRLPRKWSHTT